MYICIKYYIFTLEADSHTTLNSINLKNIKMHLCILFRLGSYSLNKLINSCPNLFMEKK
jgi:hypothetical protein